jgi:hypothetical protein
LLEKCELHNNGNHKKNFEDINDRVYLKKKIRQLLELAGGHGWKFGSADGKLTFFNHI